MLSCLFLYLACLCADAASELLFALAGPVVKRVFLSPWPLTQFESIIIFCCLYRLSRSMVHYNLTAACLNLFLFSVLGLVDEWRRGDQYNHNIVLPLIILSLTLAVPPLMFVVSHLWIKNKYCKYSKMVSGTIVAAGKCDYVTVRYSFEGTCYEFEFEYWHWSLYIVPLCFSLLFWLGAFFFVFVFEYRDVAGLTSRFLVSVQALVSMQADGYFSMKAWLHALGQSNKANVVDEKV